MLDAEAVDDIIGDADPSTACEELCSDYGYNTIDTCETLEFAEDGSVTVECTGEPVCKQASPRRSRLADRLAHCARCCHPVPQNGLFCRDSGRVQRRAGWCTQAAVPQPAPRHRSSRRSGSVAARLHVPMDDVVRNQEGDQGLL